MSNTIIESTDTTFAQDVLNAQGVTLVDFWAQWCGPCRMMLPTLEELSMSVRVIKVNVDECPHTAAYYQVRSLPTLAIFKDGQLIASKIGMMPKPSLMAWLKSEGLDIE